MDNLNEQLQFLGLNIDKIKDDINRILKMNSSTIDELKQCFSYESHDNYKHFSLLIGNNILEFIRENEYFLNDNKVTIVISKLISIFETQINNFLVQSDSNLIKSVIEPHINLKISLLDQDEITDNKMIIDNYVANYLLIWYNYQDLISKIVKQILHKYILHVCINKLDKTKFLYVLICAVADYIWKYAKNSTENNPLRQKINDEFKKIDDNISFLVDSSFNQYLNYSIELVKNTKNIEISANKDFKISTIVISTVSLFLKSLFKKNSIIEQYLIIGKIFESLSITNDLIETLIKFDDNNLENIKYCKILSGEVEGLSIRQFELKGDEQFLFTNIQMGKLTKINDKTIFNNLLNNDGNVKFLDVHSKYHLKNMKKIVSYISDNELFQENTNLMEYLTNEILMDENKLCYLDSLLKDFKIKRFNTQLNLLTNGEKQRIKIIRMLLEDLPIWIINDCFTNINSDTKKQIMNRIKEKLKNKTVLLIDTSENNNYWDQFVNN